MQFPDNLLTALSSGAVAKESAGSAATGNSSQDATVFSLIYGLPLASYVNLALSIEKGLGEFTTNTFYHQQQLATGGFTDINRPNVDTLYSEALVDLSSQDLVVTIPEVKDRFYVFPFYDIYGNNFANLGTATKSAPGNYLVSYRPADPGHKRGDDTYTGYIYMPTPYGAIDLRIQVNGPDDVANVNALQVQFKLKPVPIPVQLAPALTKPLLCDGLPNPKEDLPSFILQLTARLSLFNLPEVGSDIAFVTSVLQRAGLSRGSYTTPSGVDLKDAAATAVAQVASVGKGDANKYFVDLGNGWSHLRDKYSGNFKSHYLARAFVAAQGYLQLTAEQAIYPVYDLTSGQLTSTKSYTVTFSGRPPVDGFWSITAYAGAYLVKNVWNIYSLGDRSDIKDVNGNPVYGSGSSSSDVEFKILFQTEDIPPPKEDRSNWIPTPGLKGDSQEFNFTVRWYGPTAALSDGKYKYPTVSKPQEPIKPKD